MEAELVQDYLWILKKSWGLPHYRVEQFREEEAKLRMSGRLTGTPTSKAANPAFFTYDKTAQLAMLGVEGEKLQSGRILRLEV